MYTKKPFSPIPPTPPAVTPKRRRFILAIGLVPVALALTLAGLPFSRTTRAIEPPRKFNSSDIHLADGYRIQAAITNLTAPTTAIFDGNDLLVAESGSSSAAPARILRITEDGTVSTIVSRGLRGFVAGLAIKDGRLYVSHKGKVSVIDTDGKLRDNVTDLPSNGEHQNNNIAFGPDGKLYLGQGTVTNAGVVGVDDYALGWLNLYPDLSEIPCQDVPLLGQNYQTQNPLSQQPHAVALTGAYEPFGVPTIIGENAKGDLKCGGSILRFNPDGSNLELVAWGLRNPVGLKFDRAGQLGATSQGTETRGSRHILNDPDYFVRVERGAWYGWPDYFDGRPVTDDRFIVPGKPQAGFVWDAHPRLSKAYLTFSPHAASSGFAFSPGGAFGYEGDAFVAMAGPVAADEKSAGFRIARVDLKNGHVSDFATNVQPGPAYANQLAGFDHPTDILFGPDGSMYVVDPGVAMMTAQGLKYSPGTGAIWRIYAANGHPLRNDRPLAIQPEEE